MSRILIISSLSPKPYLELLKGEGCKLIFTKEQTTFPIPERYHADLQCFAPDEGTLIVTPSLYEYYKDCLKDTGIAVLSGKTESDGHYPSRIAYNVARVGNTAFCLEKALDEVVREELEKRNISVCNVSQGYASCSVTGINERALITSDVGIAKAAEKRGFDSLYVSTEHILLPGFDHGFIGGCVSRIRPDLFAVSGSELSNSFLAFFEQYKANLVTISGQLFDFGGSISLEGK